MPRASCLVLRWEREIEPRASCFVPRWARVFRGARQFSKIEVHRCVGCAELRIKNDTDLYLKGYCLLLIIFQTPISLQNCAGVTTIGEIGKCF